MAAVTETTTLYARVPMEMKQATDRYAADHGMTIAGAVTDLLGRGLQAASTGCDAGAGGPFQCELLQGHGGSHVSTFKWDGD